MTPFRIGRVCKTKGMDDRVGWGRGGHEGQEGRKGGQKHGGERDNWPRGPMDKASAYGAGDCRFESCRGHCAPYACLPFIMFARTRVCWVGGLMQFHTPVPLWLLACSSRVGYTVAVTTNRGSAT